MVNTFVYIPCGMFLPCIGKITKIKTLTFGVVLFIYKVAVIIYHYNYAQEAVLYPLFIT